MENPRDNEKLIGKLIKKRKTENEAFIKILNAIESKGSSHKEKAKRKTKS